MRIPQLSSTTLPGPLAWFLLLAALAAAYALHTAVLEPSGILQAFTEQLRFFGVGILGAIFANSTGAGGGVVFLPVFAKLGLSESQAVATSFGIQCFGMTAGALTWTYFYRQQGAKSQWTAFLPVVAVCVIASVAGLWTVYGVDLARPASLSLLFAGFSLLLGASILVASRRGTQPLRQQVLSAANMVELGTVAYAGGIITAWLSVGVGELVAIYLILRRFDATFAVAVAVVISAITVWSAAPQQLLSGDQAQWQIILLAGPGAIIGGLIARPLVLKLGAQRLKLFFGCWLLILGLVEIVQLS